MELVSSDWLQNQLSRPKSNDHLLVLDCRLQAHFLEHHIKGSANFFLPTLILRRLHQKKLDLFSTIKCRQLKSRIMSNYTASKSGNFTFVLYTETNNKNNASGSDAINSFVVLKNILIEDGCTVTILEDEFSTFSKAYPEWCESTKEILDFDYNATEQLMGLRSLRISTPFSDSVNASSSESSDCEYGVGFLAEQQAPVEILHWLWLGNSQNSKDLDALQKYNIRYILNVTPDLPNVFERTKEITYLQIPIVDNWSQDLSVYFPKAIQFIEEARSKDTACLVHCLAGVSRSVTITLAYLMWLRMITLDEAFLLLRSRKPDISPNVHFMRQLQVFEKQLQAEESGRYVDTPLPGPSTIAVRSLTRGKRSKYDCPCIEGCKCPTAEQLFGPFTGVSPDSGIEFDRWSRDNTPK